MRICEHPICYKTQYGRKWLLVCQDCAETQRELSESEIAAITLGTLGGKVKSPKKSLSSKKNGKLGGRPKNPLPPL